MTSGNATSLEVVEPVSPVATNKQQTIIHLLCFGCIFFFFQAEDGIRDLTVTGVQTCALPIFAFPLVPSRSYCQSSRAKIVKSAETKNSGGIHGNKLSDNSFRENSPSLLREREVPPVPEASQTRGFSLARCAVGLRPWANEMQVTGTAAL